MTPPLSCAGAPARPLAAPFLRLRGPRLQPEKIEPGDDPVAPPESRLGLSGVERDAPERNARRPHRVLDPCQCGNVVGVIELAGNTHRGREVELGGDDE